MTIPLVSVIIPAFNEEKIIERNLLALRSQDYKNIEIIVVDDSSTDSTALVAKKHTNLVFTRKHSERSIQRNFGATKAKGEYLLFLDADMELSKEVVKDCIMLINSDRNLGGIAIPETPIASNFWERVKAFERSIYNLEGDETTDAARFFMKDIFDKVGGYDENITGPEDWDLPEGIKKLGYKIGRIKSKIKHYERITSPFSLAKKKYYYGLKVHRYLEKNNVSPVSTKTIYFLRPIFYKNWKILISHPILTTAMFFMLTLEQFAGGVGYLIGKYRKL